MQFRIDRTFITNSERMYSRRLDPLPYTVTADTPRDAATEFLAAKQGALISIDEKSDGTFLATASSPDGIFMITVRPAS